MSMVGKEIRFNRLFGGEGNVVVVAVDHGAEFGPTPGLVDFISTLERLGEADAILLNPGMLESSAPFFGRLHAPRIILRVTWTTAYCYPWNYRESHTCCILDPEEAVALGADAVMACCLLQTGSEALDRDNVRLFAEIAAGARRAGLPLIAELLPVDAEIMPPGELHERILRGVRIMAELGADAVKTCYTGERFGEVTGGATVPVLALGASKRPEDEAVEMARAAVRAGARGVVFGRNVFQAQDPSAFLARLKAAVNEG